MAQKINSPQMNPSKTVDANGWTVYNYGAWKEYCKQFTGTTVTINAGTSTNLLNGVSLPTGMSNITGKLLDHSVGMQYTYAFSVIQEANVGTTPQDVTSLRFVAWNGGAVNAGTGNWYINVRIRE